MRGKYRDRSNYRGILYPSSSICGYGDFLQMESSIHDAKKCMEYRKAMGKEDIKVLADVQVKHAHMVLPYITVEQSAKEAVDSGADGIIVTGTQIGEETPMDLIKRVKNVVKVPVFAGSGVKAENIKDQLQIADGAIIGSSLKEGGIISNPISYDLVKKVLDGLNA